MIPHIFTESKFTFDERKSYEQVSLLLYRHWFVLFSNVLGFVFFAALPFAVYAVGRSYLALAHLQSVFWFLASLYFLVWWSSLFYMLTMYLLDVWIVTDHRVVDSQQHGFFKRTVSELNLSKIQDISVTIRGPIRTFLDFGDLEIQTAGTAPKFCFREIPHPRDVKDEIMRMHNQYLATHKNGVEIHEP